MYEEIMTNDADGLVCDAVSLQKLLELLGIVAQTIITSDYVEQA